MNCSNGGEWNGRGRLVGGTGNSAQSREKLVLVAVEKLAVGTLGKIANC